MRLSINAIDNLAKIVSEKFSNRLFDTMDKIYRNIILNKIPANFYLTQTY